MFKNKETLKRIIYIYGCDCFQFDSDVYITTVAGGFHRRPNVTRIYYYFLVNDVPVSTNGRFSIDSTSGHITFDGTGLTNKNFNRTFVRTPNVVVVYIVVLVKKGKGTVKPLMEVFHGTATECHLPYGITQCYLLPDTSEHTPP